MTARRHILAIAAVALLGRRVGAVTVEDSAAEQIRSVLPPELALVSLSVPGGDKAASADLAVVWHGAPRPGPTTVQLTAGSEKVWARVIFAEVGVVVVARRALAPKETIRPGDLARESRPIVGGRELTLDPAYLDGAQAARAITAGAPLTAGDLILPPPVPRGTEVRVVVLAGGARVTSRGTLERAAHVGERSIVRLDGIARIVEGELVDPSTIRISRGTR